MASQNCLCCKNHVNCCACSWTKEVIKWSKSLRSFPKVSVETIYKWLEKGGKKNASEKSYKFFHKGYVFNVYTSGSTRNQNNSCVKARYYRSFRKSEQPHFLVVKFDSGDKMLVSSAHCSCKGVSGGHCNHVFALIFVLNDYACMNVYDIPSNATCTSLPQSWHNPRSSSICPMPVMGTQFARAETDRDQKRSRDPIRCKLYEARGPPIRSGFSSEHVARHVGLLSNRDKPPPFSYLLSDQEPSLVINTVFGNVTLGSCLAYQMLDFGRSNTVFVSNAQRIVNPCNDLCTSFPNLNLFIQPC